MSVIGRLGKQVEDVLINPLERNRRGAQPSKERQREAHTPSDAETDNASAGQENSARRPDKEDLPVWLL